MTRSAKLARAVNRHKGQWVAVDTAGKRVVGYGKTVSEAVAKAREHSVTNAVIAKVPTTKVDAYFF